MRCAGLPTRSRSYRRPQHEAEAIERLLELEELAYPQL
jgi:hypothetical protein